MTMRTVKFHVCCDEDKAVSQNPNREFFISRNVSVRLLNRCSSQNRGLRLCFLIANKASWAVRGHCLSFQDFA